MAEEEEEPEEVKKVVEDLKAGRITQKDALWNLFDMGYEEAPFLERVTGAKRSSIYAEHHLWKRAKERVPPEKKPEGKEKVLEKITYKDFITLRERFKEDGVLGEEAFPSIPGETASSTPDVDRKISSLGESLVELAKSFDEFKGSVGESFRKLAESLGERRNVYYGRVKSVKDEKTGKTFEYDLMPEDEVNVTLSKKLVDEGAQTMKTLRSEVSQIRKDLSYIGQRILGFVETEVPRFVEVPKRPPVRLVPPASEAEAQRAIQERLRKLEEEEKREAEEKAEE